MKHESVASCERDGDAHPSPRERVATRNSHLLLSMAHEISIHVYPTDCDMLGHVNHATMISFLERARWSLLEDELVHGSGGAQNVWQAFGQLGVWTVVRHVDIAYNAQVMPGDDIVIRSGLIAIGNTSFAVRQEVRKKHDRSLAAEAKLTFVCIGPDGRPRPVPDRWRTLFPSWPGSGPVAPITRGSGPQDPAAD